MQWNWRKYIDGFLSWSIIYFVISLIWIGAEHAFEGVVHTSCVDAIVCGVLSAFISRSIQNKQ